MQTELFEKCGKEKIECPSEYKSRIVIIYTVGSRRIYKADFDNILCVSSEILTNLNVSRNVCYCGKAKADKREKEWMGEKENFCLTNHTYRSRIKFANYCIYLDLIKNHEAKKENMNIYVYMYKKWKDKSKK